MPGVLKAWVRRLKVGEMTNSMGRVIAMRSRGFSGKFLSLFFLFMFLSFILVPGVLLPTSGVLGNFGLTFNVTSGEPLSLKVDMISPSSGQTIETAAIDLVAESTTVAICRMSTNRENTTQTFDFTWTPFVLDGEAASQSFGYGMILEVNSQEIVTEGFGHSISVDIPSRSDTNWIEIDVCTFKILPDCETASLLVAGTYRATIRVEVEGA